ncbi:hypothetical protein D3C76_720450 [compost metagenome]
MLGREGEPDPGLQLAAGDGRRDPAWQRTGPGLAADEGHVVKTGPILLDQAGDQALIGELLPLAHPVHQHQILETLEGLPLRQHGEERAYGRAGGEQPEIPSRRELVQGQEPRGLGLNQQGIPRLQGTERGSQFAIRDLHQIEFVIGGRGGIDEGIRALDPLLAPLQGQLGKLPRLVGGEIRRYAQGKQGGRPLDALEYPTFDPGCHTGSPPKEQNLTLPLDPLLIQKEKNPRMCAGFFCKANRYYRATTWICTVALTSACS